MPQARPPSHLYVAWDTQYRIDYEYVVEEEQPQVVQQVATAPAMKKYPAKQPVTGEDEADPGEADPGETIDWVGESVVSRPTKARQPGPGEIAGSGEAGPGEITGSGEAGAGETSPGKASPGETGPASEEAGTGRARAEEPSPGTEEPGPGVHGACTRPLPTSGAVDGSGSDRKSVV